MDYINLLQDQFNGQIKLTEKRPGIAQLFVPLYYEDGDMLDIFLEKGSNGSIRICDHGMSIMRLSYSYDIDTPNKERIFEQILTENGLTEVEGNIYIEVNPEGLYPGLLQFAQGIAKVSNMQLFKREVIRGLFYEQLEEFVQEKLREFEPISHTYPITNREDLEVDYRFNNGKRPIFLFGVRDSAKARLVTISCLEFVLKQVSFKSCIVHEDLTVLNKKDLTRITNAVDKQFPTLDDFKNNGEIYLRRELSV